MKTTHRALCALAIAAMAILNSATLRAAGIVQVDLGNVSVTGGTTSVSLANATINTGTLYTYDIVGNVAGTGLLSGLIPATTTLPGLFNLLGLNADVQLLSGTVANPSGLLPLSGHLFDIDVTGGNGLLSGLGLRLHLVGDIDLNGQVSVSLSDAGSTLLGLPLDVLAGVKLQPGATTTVAAVVDVGPTPTPTPTPTPSGSPTPTPTPTPTGSPTPTPTPLPDGTGTSPWRPDLRIGGRRTPTQGNNIYNSTSIGQTSRVIGPIGFTKTLFIDLQNDGYNPDSLMLKGDRSSSEFRIQYFAGHTNISAAVKAGTYATPVMQPGAITEIKARVQIMTPDAFHKRIFQLQTTSSTGTTLRDMGSIKAVSE